MSLIRKDLTTVLCEVTCSIRTAVPEEEPQDPASMNATSSVNCTVDGSATPQQELLLCLRPIRDGDKKADRSLAFVYPATCETVEMETDGEKSPVPVGSALGEDGKPLLKKPPKKRTLPKSSNMGSKTKKKKKSDANASETEKSVVESLMLMNKSSL